MCFLYNFLVSPGSVEVDGGAIQWGAAVAYDGAFATGANLLLGHTLQGPMKIKGIKIYKRILSDGEINALGD